MTKSRGLRVSKGTRPKWVAENQGLHVCECGCGAAIPLKPEHYPNAPRFIHGHNQLGVIRRVKPPPQPCECGCGELATVERRFLPGHNGLGQKRSAATKEKLSVAKIGSRNPMFGKHAPNFKGRIYNRDGYVLIWLPEHPYASNGRVFEHRLAVEKQLRETEPDSPYLVKHGRSLYLRPGVDVHHDDEVKDNNAPENLIPLWRSEHALLHYDQRGNPRWGRGSVNRP